LGEATNSDTEAPALSSRRELVAATTQLRLRLDRSSWIVSSYEDGQDIKGREYTEKEL